MSANIGNIELTTADLQKVRPDIELFLFEGQSDFSNQIEAANREEYRNVSKQLRLEYPENTEAEIEDLILKVKDHPVEETLKDRRVYIALSLIFSASDQYEESEHYRKLAEKTPIRYFIDSDDNGVQGTDETRNLEPRRITFGR
jgi:hypothetical protein